MFLCLHLGRGTCTCEEHTHGGFWESQCQLHTLTKIEMPKVLGCLSKSKHLLYLYMVFLSKTYCNTYYHFYGKSFLQWSMIRGTKNSMCKLRRNSFLFTCPFSRIVHWYILEQTNSTKLNQTQYKCDFFLSEDCYENHSFGIMRPLSCNYQIGYLIVFVIANS